jgi:hypothetical protein
MWNTDKIEEHHWNEKEQTRWKDTKKSMVTMITTEIENKTKELLGNRNWTFGQLQSMGSIVDEFTETIYTELEPKQKMDLIWYTDTEPYLSAERPFGKLMQMMVKHTISETVAVYLKNELLNANVNFNGGDKNEVPKGSVGRKSSKKRTTDEEKDSEE